jgi:hypothetical protein
MSNTFLDPRIDDGEKSVYALRLDGTDDATEVTSLIEHQDDTYVSSITSSRGPEFSFSVEQSFQRNGATMSAHRYKAEARSDGEVVSREEGYFSNTKHIQFGGNVAEFPRNVMPVIGGLTLLRGLDFRKGAKQTVNVWLAFSICWPLEVKVEKQTRVDVPAGTFDVWQVRVRPSFNQISGLLDKVVAGFLPPFIAHFETAHAHRMVRFSFPSGPMPWNPRGVIELSA